MEIFSLVICLMLVSSSSGAITFDGIKSSFAQFRPWQPSSSQQGFRGTLSLHFKTHLKDSLIAYQDDGINDYLSIELVNGKVLTKFGTASTSVRVEIGQDLADMNWHVLAVKLTDQSVRLTLDKTLTKTVNNPAKNKALFKSSGYLYIGGLPRSLSLSSISWTGAAFKKGFVGCVKKIMMTNNENNRERAVLIKSKGTKSGCLNECRARNPCLNNGKCINRFSKVKCDCSGTGFEGLRCEKEIIQVHLNKNDYIIYDMSSTPAATKADLISLKFKTSKKNAILLETSFSHDYVIIKVSKGFVIVEWNLGSGQLQMIVQDKKVHDNKWHELVIKRTKREVTASLDNGADVQGTTPPRHTTFNMHGGESRVYIGGDGVSSGKKFEGCLRHVKFNGIELIAKLKAKDPRLSVSGNAMWNCPEPSTTIRPTTATIQPTTTLPPITIEPIKSRSRNWEQRQDVKSTSNSRTQSTLKSTNKPTKPTAHFRKTTDCSPNDVRCVMITLPKTQAPKPPPKKATIYRAKPTEEPSTENDMPTAENITSTTTNTPQAQGLKDVNELGNVPTAIGLVVGSIVLFAICAVISLKLKKIRDRNSHAHQITIEHREVDEIIDSKVESYDNNNS